MYGYYKSLLFLFVVVFYATVPPWECRKRCLFRWLWRVCGFKFLLLDAVWRVALNVVDPRSGDMFHWDWGCCWYCSTVWFRGTCVLCSLLPLVTMASFMNKQRNVVNISKFICSIYLWTHTHDEHMPLCVCVCVCVIKLNTELPSVLSQKHSLATFTAPVATSILSDEFLLYVYVSLCVCVFSVWVYFFCYLSLSTVFYSMLFCKQNFSLLFFALYLVEFVIVFIG